MIRYYYLDDYKLLYKKDGSKAFGYLLSKKKWIYVGQIPRNARLVTIYCLDHPAFIKERFYKELLE